MTKLVSRLNSGASAILCALLLLFLGIPSVHGATVAAGAGHTVVVGPEGRVWAWGSGALGQLGDGAGTSRLVPEPVSGLTGVVAVAAGANHTLALKMDGSLWAWGDSSSGQASAAAAGVQLVPVRVEGIPGTVVAIAAGDRHSVALTLDGRVWTWGDNSQNQLANGGTTSRGEPAAIDGLAAIGIGAGADHTLAVLAGGVVRA